MCFLQSENIIHCDLKPANFLITNGKVSICDLATCWKIRENNKITRRSLNFGSTPNYAPPEFQTEDEVGLFSDIWSLGVILHKLYCKGYPKVSFKFKDVKIVEEGGESPEEIVKIVRMCLQFEGGKRSSLKEIVNQFQDFENKIARKKKWHPF